MSSLTELMRTKRWCYFLNKTKPSEARDGTFMVSVVVEGEAGHFPTGGGDKDPLKAPWYWDEKTCEAENQKLGYDEMEAWKIVTSSMAAGRV
jgi:hypothetical protein